MPQQLQSKPEADTLAFGKYFTDHMMKVFWHKCLGGWQRPEISPMENLVIHPAAKVLHYAVEVIIFLFSLFRHYFRHHTMHIALVEIPIKQCHGRRRISYISPGMREEIVCHDQNEPCFRL